MSSAAPNLLALALAVLGAGDAPVRIMPVGDSVTETNAGYASWRYWLWQDLRDLDYDVDFVGSQNGVFGGPPLYPDFDADHEAHSGWQTAEMAAAVAGFAAVEDPAIALVHMGNTDLVHAVPVTSALLNLGTIAEQLRAVNPAIAIVVAQIVPTTDGVQSLATVPIYNANVPALAAALDRPASRVFVVDQYTGFDPALDSYDGFHPSQSGEQKISARWQQPLLPILDALDAPDFVPGDRIELTPTTPADRFEATFDGVAGMKLKLTFLPAVAALSSQVLVLEPDGNVLAAFDVAHKKKTKKQVVLHDTGRHRIRIDDFFGNLAPLAIATSRKLPKSAKSVAKQVKLKAGQTAFGLDFRALPRAAAAATFGASGAAAELGVVLRTPDGAALDLADATEPLAGGGVALDSTPLLIAGTYRLEVSGLPSAGGKVKAKLALAQPASGGAVVVLPQR